METYYEMMPLQYDVYLVLESYNQDVNHLNLYNATHAIQNTDNTAVPNALSLNQSASCCINQTSEYNIQDLENSIISSSSNSTVSTLRNSSFVEIPDILPHVHNQENQNSDANRSNEEWDKTQLFAQNTLNSNMFNGQAPIEGGCNEIELQNSIQEKGIQGHSTEQGHTITYPRMAMSHMDWDKMQPFDPHTFSNNLLTDPVFTEGGFNEIRLQTVVQEIGIQGPSTGQGHNMTFPGATTPHMAWYKSQFLGQHTLCSNLVTDTAVMESESNEILLQNVAEETGIQGTSTGQGHIPFSPTEKTQINNVQTDTPQLFDNHTSNRETSGLALAEAMINELENNSPLTITKINHRPTDNQRYSSAYRGETESRGLKKKRKKRVLDRGSEAYRKMRENNNKATKKSRQKAQLRRQEHLRRMNELELENLELSKQNDDLEAKLNIFTYLSSLGSHAGKSVPRSMDQSFSELHEDNEHMPHP